MQTIDTSAGELFSPAMNNPSAAEVQMQATLNADTPKNQAEKITPLIFTGNAREYFGIWIVNLLLSLLTFGIYSAWAKVRRKKYFYNNTLLENVGFDYHANPISILKGRIIAFVFFLAYGFSQQIPFLTVALLIVLLIAMPWLVIRSATFNARNTSHRGLRFDFVGKTKEAVRTFIWLPILTLITMFLGYPYAMHQKQTFLINNHRFGNSAFDFKGKVNEFYLIFIKYYGLVMLVFALLIGIILGIVFGVQKGVGLNKSTLDKLSEARPATQQVISLGVAALAPINGFWHLKTVKLAVAEAQTPTPVAEEMTQAEIDAEITQYADQIAEEKAGLELTPEQQAEADAEIDTRGNATTAAEDEFLNSAESEAEAIPEMTPEEILAETKRKQNEKLKEMLKDPKAVLAILGGLFAYLAFALMSAGYIQARIGNLVWNSTTFDEKIKFKSSLRARDFAWLYFSNLVAIIITFGLATPWAQVRTAKYRLSKLQLVGDVDYDKFAGDKKLEVKAAGEELADMFDIDLSFG